MTNNNEKRIGSVKRTVLTVVLMSAAVFAQSAQKAVETGTARRVVISIADRKLALIEDDVVVKVYPVAVGAAVSPSPTGDFKIATRLSNPTYYHPGKVIGPGAQNPLGTRWMGLNQKGYGIHGTNAPKSIGKAASHGCIRMAKADLEDLFNRVKVGDGVEIRSGVEETTMAIFHPTVHTSGAETVVATAMTSGMNGAE